MKSPSIKKLAISTAVVALATIVGSVIHGQLVHRWGTPADLIALGEQLDALPRDVGPWRLDESTEITPTVQEMLRCVGYLNRTYVHRTTGATVQVAVMLGPTAPIAVHTPEICYSSKAYTVRDARRRVTLDKQPTGETSTQEQQSTEGIDEFWRLSFSRRNAIGDDLRVYYAWNAGERWTAPDNQRFAYLGKPWLYKIQLATYVPPNTRAEDADAGAEFLREFVPALDRAMHVHATE